MKVVSRPWLVVLAPLVLLGGCMFGPYDGEIVASSSSTVHTWGVYPGAGADVTIEARSSVDGQFYGVASTTSTTEFYTAFGTDWNVWAVSTTVPSWGWRSGITGERAELRAQDGTSMLTSYPADGLDCVLEADQAGTYMLDAQAACSSTSTPSAFVFTPDYRGLPTFTPQDPVDYPRQIEHDRVAGIQGPASTEKDWYFTQNVILAPAPTLPLVMRIPLTDDLADESSWSNATVAAQPTVLSDLGYNHFGDPDEHEGSVFVPVEGGELGAVAQYDLDLNFRGFATLSGPKAPWVAIDPTTDLLYTSAFCDVHRVDVYTMQFNESGVLIGLTLTQQRRLWDADSVPLTVQEVQGGAFSDNGNLYLVSDAKRGTCPVAGTAGVYGFEGDSLRKEAWFDVPYDPTAFVYEELEGIDVRDLTSAGAPGITGQLHLVMLDNDSWGDDLYFKHYVAPESELGFL